MTSACHICNHGEAFHDRWGICGIAGCGPCYKDLPCPRCKHMFFDHSVSDSKVMCTDPNCKLLVCYDKKYPDKPLYTIISPEGRRLFKPGPVQPTYEETLQHPLTPRALPMVTSNATPTIVVPITQVSESPVYDPDPLIKPGVWKSYRPGREYNTAEGGYVEVDMDEKHENGSFKRHVNGRVWDTKLRGYVLDGPPPPPEKGILDWSE